MKGMSRMRLLAIARKEWIQLRRDPRSMALAFLLPVALLVFFGYAITWDVDDLELAVLNEDGGRRSRALIEAFEASGYFSVRSGFASHRETEASLARGEVRAALVIPPDFSRNLAADRSAPVQLLLDGSDANTATIALHYADAIAARFSRREAGAGRVMELPLRAETRVWYNPALESQVMIVPALIAVIMTVIAAMLTSLTIAREWERGTMEQLAATPVREFEVVFGKLLPYIVIGVADVAITIVAGRLAFGTPLRGSILQLALFTPLFLLGALGLGIFISAVTKSQVPATQFALIGTMLPAVLLSGFLFDIASMPVALRGLTHLVPARYFVTVTRGIFLKGVGVDVLWPQALFMIGFAVAGLGLATRAFRKRLA